MVDSDYAAEDIHAAMGKIIRETGLERIDLLGWSWGTVTVSRFAAMHPEMIDRLILYAPILCGIGAYGVPLMSPLLTRQFWNGFARAAGITTANRVRTEAEETSVWILPIC